MTASTEITARETLDLIESGADILIVDVRDDASFAAGHIPGAISVPANNFDFDKIQAKATLDTHIIVSCYRGMMSRDVVAFLRQRGFANVQSMSGGWDGWQRLGNAPIER